MSRLDQFYRRLLISKFFTKGWGKPDNLKRLFEFRKILSDRDVCQHLVPPDYPIYTDKDVILADHRLIEGHFQSPFTKYVQGIMPKEVEVAQLFFVGAQNGHMPKIISMINYKYLTPTTSLLTILFLVLAFQQSNDIFYLIEMEGFGFATVLMIVLAGQTYLRFKEPDLPRPIKVPLALPIILCLISAAIVILTFYQKPSESLLAFGLVFIGVIVYFFGCRWTSKPKVIQNKIDAFTMFMQRLLLVVPQESSKELQWD